MNTSNVSLSVGGEGSPGLGNPMEGGAPTKLALKSGTRGNLMPPPTKPKDPVVRGSGDVTMNVTKLKGFMMGTSQREETRSKLMRQNKFKNEQEQAKLALESAAVKVQSWFRMTRVAYTGPLAFLYFQKKARRNNAATNLQRVYRAHRARHSADMKLRIVFRLLEHAAAVRLQKVARGHMGRTTFKKIEAKGEEAKMRKAVEVLQRHVRGWRSRKLIKKELDFKRERVAVIERFCIHYFQPNQVRQTKGWNDNLWSIVAVQAKCRRFLARKRAHQLVKTRSDMLATGRWMLLWCLLLGLFILMTVWEKDGGEASAVRELLGQHLEPPGQRYATSRAARSPDGVWRWLATVLIPRYRALQRSPVCTEASANARMCTDPNGQPFHVAVNLTVRQYRIQTAQFELPGAGSQKVQDVCSTSEIVMGVCRAPAVGADAVGNAREAVLQGLPAYVNLSNVSEVTAARAWREALAGNYSGGAREVTLGLQGEESSAQTGSTWLNFTHGTNLAGQAASGRFDVYGAGGFQLHPANSDASFLPFESDASTDCGVPCEQGVQRVRLAEWFDTQTRAIIAELGIISIETNTMAVEQIMIEHTRAGGIHATRRQTAARFQAYETFGARAGDTASRQFLQALYALAGLGYLCFTFWSTHYVMHTYPNGRTRYRRREGTLWHRVKHHFASVSNVTDLAVGVLVITAGVLRISAQNMSEEIVKSPAAASSHDLVQLADLHISSDTILAIIAAYMWGRGIVSYITGIRVVRAFFPVFWRVLMPVVSVSMFTIVSVFALAHIATVTRGRSDPRFASLFLSLGSVFETMLEGVSLEEVQQHDRGWHAAEKLRRSAGASASGQSAVELAAYFLGLIVSATVGALAIARVQEEMGVTKEMETSPYLFEKGHRYDRYRSWQLPPLNEFYYWLERLVKSKESKADEIRLHMMQLRVLNQLRKGLEAPGGSSSKTFQWCLIHDKISRLQIARSTRNSLRRVSRLMGHQARAFDRSVDLVELTMEETTQGMLHNVTRLLRRGFTFAEIAWPEAVLTSEDLEEAARIVEEEREAALDETVLITARRLKNIDKQLINAESVVLEVMERWSFLLKVEAARGEAEAKLHAPRKRGERGSQQEASQQ